MFETLLALLVPPVCLACRAPLARAGGELCVACRVALPWLRRPACPRCALPSPCRPCPARGAAFAAAWAPVAHAGPARDLVVALKFRAGLAAADLMAAQVAAGVPRDLLDGATLVPVPAHPARRRSRGFDQAERLGARLAVRTQRPLHACLERAGTATRQVGAGRSERRAPGRIDLRCRGAAPEVALLVDDVHTTGATLEAAAAALRAAGARKVAAVTYTRALP